MIKVIKHGEKVFKAVCPICRCEFEYEYEDIQKGWFNENMNGCVKCPDCGEMISHREQVIKEPTIVYTPYTVPGSINGWPDCETCPNKPDPTKTIIGDTPCTWCKKNQFICLNKS